jgi:hypothetical protein
MAKLVPKIPLILRFHRLMDVFTKSSDERDFYLDKLEGFLIYADLDKGSDEIEILEKELEKQKNRFCPIPKMTFFEIKKFMEGFVNEKVYDIDTKEKLIDIINSKNARENFLEFIYEQLTELEKWQQYYQERSRIKVIEWLRNQGIQFVFEEDLELGRNVMERLKRTFFDEKVSRDLTSARNLLFNKAKVYYSIEALNPRPKRGRPPKQISKTINEPQFTIDIYMTVPKTMRPFLYIPDITNASEITFSSRFGEEEKLLAGLRGSRIRVGKELEALSERLESLNQLAKRFAGVDIERLEETLRPLKPLGKPKPEKAKRLKAIPEKKDIKMEAAVGVILPKKRGRPRKAVKAGEYIGPKKKKFGIKKVAPIKKRKRKKK